MTTTIAATAALSPRAQDMLRSELLDGETPQAALACQNAQYLVLTDRRLILLWAKMLPFMRSTDVRRLADVASMTSGVSGVSIGMRNGDDYELSFWPTPGNAKAAKALTQRLRALQSS